MKAKINKRGRLEIERKGGYGSAMCPYSEEAHCGGWCPLFIEETDCRGDPTVLLGCAQQVIVHEVIVDERVPALEPGKTEEGA